MSKFSLSILFLFHLAYTAAQGYEIYVCDVGNYNDPPWQILKFDQNGENPEVFIDNQLDSPQDILFIEDQGIVLISNYNSGLINRHDAESGAYIDVFASGIEGPTRMALGQDDLIYVLQWNGTNPVLRYQQNGTFFDEFTSVGVSQGIGLDWDEDGNLYVSSFAEGNVRKFDSTGQDLGLHISSFLEGPSNIWFDTNGDLLVLDYYGGSVDRFDGDGNFIESFINGLPGMEGVAISEDETILIGNATSNSVQEYSINGDYIQDIVLGGTLNLLTPNSIVLRHTPLGVEDLSNQDNLLVNTSGVRFEISVGFLNRINRVEVFDNKGSIIYNGTIQSNLAWNANKVMEGNYFLTFYKDEKNVGTQRVQVIH